jgi:hypothetical protein
MSTLGRIHDSTSYIREAETLRRIYNDKGAGSYEFRKAMQKFIVYQQYAPESFCVYTVLVPYATSCASIFLRGAKKYMDWFENHKWNISKIDAVRITLVLYSLSKPIWRYEYPQESWKYKFDAELFSKMETMLHYIDDLNCSISRGTILSLLHRVDLGLLDANIRQQLIATTFLSYKNTRRLLRIINRTRTQFPDLCLLWWPNVQKASILFDKESMWNVARTFYSKPMVKSLDSFSLQDCMRCIHERPMYQSTLDLYLHNYTCGSSMEK